MRTRTLVLSSMVAVCAPLAAAAANLDTIGVTLLGLVDPTLTGTNISVAQVEAGYPQFEVRPSAVGQPANLFTWTSSDGSATTFPNSVGTESEHANEVATNFYGLSTGAASGVFHVDNYEANFFVTNVVEQAASIPANVVNQSYVFGAVTIPEQQSLDSLFDDYIAAKGILFCSAVGNGGQVFAPSTCYNGIGVGVYGGGSSTGPTLDNGRSKPDIVAPETATSFSTPYVSGSAAILFEAALRGDGGAGTASAAGDLRTVKALLLNGAVKPSDWTHTNAAPLDARYGAGIVNVYNSYKQLASGKYAPSFSSSVSSGSPHPPPASATYVPSLVGWNLATIANNNSNKDALNHYCFNIPATNSGGNFTFTATVVWNRLSGMASANDIDVFLYDMSNSNLVASSVSGVDNVEHLYVPKLAPGQYDLQVLKNGAPNGTWLTAAETYAVAFEIFAMPLAIEASEGVASISWPLTPTGFRLQTTLSLSAPISWSDVSSVAQVTNNLNRVEIPATNFCSFYRLVR